MSERKRFFSYVIPSVLAFALSGVAHNKKIANIEAFIRCAEEEQEKQKGKKDNETTGS